IHVADVAAALESLAASEAAGTVNICSGEAHLPHEIALECAKLLKKPDLKRNLQDCVEKQRTTVTICGNNARLAALSENREPNSLALGLNTYLKDMRGH
ncbi:hypothetical protein, partial [Sneathiella sp.]|uniref:hypothetical protein n=1 Tax=Sneathiella sp. TaxID=1964365 RepID=UPI002620F737